MFKSRGKGKVDPRLSLRQEDPQITIRSGAEMVSVQPGGFDLDNWTWSWGRMVNSILGYSNCLLNAMMM